MPWAETGNEANVAMTFAPRCMIAADCQQARILALTAGIGLQRDGIEAGDFRQHGFQFFEELLVALRLFQRRKGMEQREIRARSPESFRMWR